MDLTKEAINRIVELAEPKTIDVENQKYATGPLYRIEEPVANALHGFSLSAVVEYLRTNPDNIKKCLIEIFSKSVRVTAPLNSDMNRSIYFHASPNPVDITFGRFIDVEEFKIMILSRFKQDENAQKLIKFLSSLCDESREELKDNGISQSITAKVGIAQLDNIEVPNPIILTPFRTFCDIEQPGSQFLFRMQKGLRCALFEADGGAWRLDEVNSIKAYLSEGLKSITDIEICILG